MGEWKEYKLKDICTDISYGYTASASDEPIGPKFLRITDIVKERINWETVPFCKIDKEFIPKYQLRLGDIVIARTGATTGYNAIIKHNHNAIFASYLIRYRVDEKIAHPSFIGFLLKSYEWNGFVDNIIGGSAQPGANAQQFADFEFILPPLSEQRTIASILSSLDDKIDLLHRQNQTLEALAETLFRQWFVEKADEGWEMGKLGDILEIIESGSRPKGGIDPDLKEGIPSIGAESINGLGHFDFSKTKYVTHEFFESMRRGRIRGYDVLIYKDGAYIGRKGMFGNGFPYDVCTVNEHVFILRTNEKANQCFLYFLLKQDELEQLNANSAQPGLNQESMRSLEIAIPPKNLIDDFETIAKAWIDKIFFNCIQIRTLTQLRDSLLPRLMSGEVRV